MYTVKLKVVKFMLRGCLSGLTIEESIRHVDMSHAESWIRGVRRNCKDYTIISYTVESI